MRLLSGDLFWGPPFTSGSWVLCWLFLLVVPVGISFFVANLGVVACLCVVFLFMRVCCECLPEVPLPGRCFMFVCVCCECLAVVLLPRVLFHVCLCLL